MLPVSLRSSWKNLWLKIKATPLISSTLASAVVLRLMKFAVIAMANFPRNSFLRKPVSANNISGYRLVTYQHILFTFTLNKH